MNEFIATLDAAIHRHTSQPPPSQEITVQTAEHLLALRAAVQSGHRASMEREAARLNRFWLHRVPWCSPLSRELEKLLIQYEACTGAGQSPDTPR